MVDPVKLMLLWNYYNGRFMGVFNFEVDFATGRAWVSRSATFYAVLVNMLAFSMMPVLIHANIWTVFWQKMRGLHQYVFVTVMFLRVACVLLTILHRWWLRHRIVCLLRHFRRMVLEQPQVMKLWRRGVINKFITSMLVDGIQMAMTLNGLRNHHSLSVTISVFTMNILVAVLNIILSQYYFGLLNLHCHYVLFNEELRSILAETEALELDHRTGVKILKSCALADRIDSLAYLQSDLQTLIDRMMKIFGFQTLCLSIILYMSLIASFYHSLLIVKFDSEHFQIFSWNVLILAFGMCVYLADIHITFSMTYRLEDQHIEFKQRLMHSTPFAPDLDVRLQNAIQSFQLQLMRNPLELSVMGLYNNNRAFIVPMIDSLIVHTLIIIQYDIKNF